MNGILNEMVVSRSSIVREEERNSHYGVESVDTRS